MHTSALNVYAAGDVALAYNVTAGRRIRAEHWRDAAQQGRIAGLSAAGHQAAWHKVPEFSCTIGESTLKYCGWGIEYDHSRLVDHHVVRLEMPGSGRQSRPCRQCRPEAGTVECGRGARQFVAYSTIGSFTVCPSGGTIVNPSGRI
jgi:NADPH-dependent 2,4-dienoyl-CoA reductase/sulfur reductase-like enzyme